MNFKQLYDEEDPILVCNVWDVESAKIAQQLDFKVIGTSSGAIATMFILTPKIKPLEPNI